MRQLFTLFLAGIALSAITFPAAAGDLKLEARLIRGVNDDKDAAKYKPVDAELSGKLNHAFKWKSYVEISNKTSSVGLHKSCDFKLGDTYAIRVSYLGTSRLEVHCLSQGKELCKGNYTLKPQQWLILGGDDTGNTAWFIGLRAVDDKSDPAKIVSKN
jgi:hypothetical protein